MRRGARELVAAREPTHPNDDVWVSLPYGQSLHADNVYLQVLGSSHVARGWSHHATPHPVDGGRNPGSAASREPMATILAVTPASEILAILAK